MRPLSIQSKMSFIKLCSDSAGGAMDKDREKFRKNVYEVIEIGDSGEHLSRTYDVVSTVIVLINLTVTVLGTFSDLEAKYGGIFLILEAVTALFFLADYVEEDGGGFVVGVLGDEAAFYCFLQNAFL